MMRNKTLALTKVFLKNTFNTQTAKEKNKTANTVKMLILYIILFAYLGAVVAFLSYGQIKVLQAMGQAPVFLSLIFIGVSAFVLIQSILSGINVLYFSKDLEFVLQLPLTPKQILLAKMNVIIFSEYVTELIIGVVPLILYGILTGASAIYYVFMVIALLILPLFPTAVGTLITMLIMSFAKFSKNKDKFQLITTILIIGLTFFLQFGLSQTNNMSSEEADQFIANKIIESSTTINQISNYFVTLPSINNALTNPDIAPATISMAKAIIITLAAYVVLIEIGRKIYLSGALASNSGKIKKTKKLNASKVEKQYAKHKVSVSYVKKEFIMLLKNPIFFMQCVLPSIFLPLMMIFIIVIQFTNQSNVNEMNIGLEQLTEMGKTLLMCIIIVIIQFMNIVSMTTVTAISRDREHANFMKYIPISLYDQFIYKMMPGVILNIPAIIIALVAFGVVTKFQFLDLTMPIIIISIILDIIVDFFSVIIDLKHPKLKWNSEYEVVKQNINA